MFWDYVPLPFTAQSEDHTIRQSELIVETVKQPITEKSPTKYTATKDELIGFLLQQFTLYGIEDQYSKALEVIKCESGFQIYPKPNGISWGYAQFTPDTWHDYGYGDIMNPYVQIETMAKMWSIGLQHRWDCY